MSDGSIFMGGFSTAGRERGPRPEPDQHVLEQQPRPMAESVTESHRRRLPSLPRLGARADPAELVQPDHEPRGPLRRLCDHALGYEPANIDAAVKVVERCNGLPPQNGTTEWLRAATEMIEGRYAPGAVTMFNGTTLVLGGSPVKSPVAHGRLQLRR